MRSKAPFFPGFQRHLFGRPPVSTLQKLERGRHEIEQCCLSQLVTIFGSFLRVSLLEFKTEGGVNSRGRIYTPSVTFWAFLGQVLDVGSSCRKTVSNVQALFAARALPVPSPETKAYCRELLMHMIAYNLIRAQVLRSGAEMHQVSFKGTVDRVSSWAWLIWAAPTRKKAQKLVAALLENIAADLIPQRPGRREPRVIKRRVRAYQYLTKPRHKIAEIPHRSRYRKAA